MSSVKSILHPRLRAYQVWGTHQGVGKTIASAILCLSALFHLRGPKGAFYNVAFSKPVDYKDKGPKDLDAYRVQIALLRWRAGKKLPMWFETRNPFDPQHKGDDGKLLTDITDYAKFRADYIPSERGQPPPASWVFFETLADVEALLPSENCQADVYRELQLPGLLVGDTRPGGVESTINAFEFLRRRDYDVQSIIVFKDAKENHVKISEHFEKLGIRCVALRCIPERQDIDKKDKAQMLHFLSSMARANIVKGLLEDLAARQARRIKAAEGRLEISKEVAGLF